MGSLAEWTQEWNLKVIRVGDPGSPVTEIRYRIYIPYLMRIENCTRQRADAQQIYQIEVAPRNQLFALYTQNAYRGLFYFNQNQLERRAHVELYIYMNCR